MHKIAFLFLTITGVCHEDYWQDFFLGYEDHCTIYVHSKQGVPKNSFFKPFELLTCVPTSWERTMRAQILLLQEALKDPENQKFIFVSENTLPLTDFKTVYSFIMSNTLSIFYYEKSPHRLPSNVLYAKRNLHPIPLDLQYKSSQWVILTRKHAELMVQDTYYLDIITKYESDQELYPGTFLASQSLLDEVLPRETTYVNWSRNNLSGPKFYPPYIFIKLIEPEEFNCVCSAIENGFLFARKFPEKTKLRPIDHILAYRIAMNTPCCNCMDQICSEQI